MTDATTHRTAALRAYRAAPLATRLHVGARWATCPFDELAGLVPGAGDILDLGCGHGLLSIHLAVKSAARRVVGVDIDESKLGHAGTAAAAAGVAHRVVFDVVEPRWAPPPDSFDCVVVADVLYLLNANRLDTLLTSCVAAVRPGGCVVVKEMADGPRWKRGVTTAQEFISVRIAGITNGVTLTLHPESSITAPLQRSGAEVSRHDFAQHSIHPHVAFVARRPGLS